MATYTALGYGLFWVGLVVSIILYAVKRKWYPIVYVISVALYIFTVTFVIEAFSLSKNWILLLLALSSALMIGVGVYLSRRFKEDKK
ncbi:hypothetical protein A3K63_02635 [Candidatus Micrarchaeota archaeon RBG_16_49_10]|nr:MAG: hypothetical protein A3K63_02635 [Candidatus Micrarchaeota archaeon RBG_16_49_10]